MIIIRNTCSITSGAIQQGVPTNVFLTLLRVTSPPVAKNALTPKSGKVEKLKSVKLPITKQKFYILEIKSAPEGMPIETLHCKADLCSTTRCSWNAME